MLAHFLALAVGLGSFGLYMAAFFFPEVHRKYDFTWSGVGLFYALVLWVCAGRITGGVLLGQTASVALLGWFGWQTLKLRRELTPLSQQTQVSGSAKSVGVTLQSRTAQLQTNLQQILKRVSVPAPVQGVVTGISNFIQGALSSAPKPKPQKPPKSKSSIAKTRPNSAPTASGKTPADELADEATTQELDEVIETASQINTDIAVEEAISEAVTPPHEEVTPSGSQGEFEDDLDVDSDEPEAPASSSSSTLSSVQPAAPTNRRSSIPMIGGTLTSLRGRLQTALGRGNQRSKVPSVSPAPANRPTADAPTAQTDLADADDWFEEDALPDADDTSTTADGGDMEAIAAETVDSPTLTTDDSGEDTLLAENTDTELATESSTETLTDAVEATLAELEAVPAVEAKDKAEEDEGTPEDEISVDDSIAASAEILDTPEASTENAIEAIAPADELAGTSIEPAGTPEVESDSNFAEPSPSPTSAETPLELNPDSAEDSPTDTTRLE